MRNFGSVRLEGDGVVILPAVTRVTIVSKNGREYERFQLWDPEGVEIHIQDDGKTIKVFPLRANEESF